MNNSPEVTICVLTYGSYASLAQKCINSIIAMCPQHKYKLVVGANAAGKETLDYLRAMKERGWVHELILSDVNINKCPMMRQMFRHVDTEYIWWFDDDSYITHPDALDQRLDIAHRSGEGTVMWGHEFFFGHERDFNYGTDVVGFVKNAPWYKGLEPPSWEKGGKGESDFQGQGTGDGRWFFLTGGGWFIKTGVIRKLDWPDTNLIKRNDDVFLCEAIRQQGWSFQNIGTAGVAINTEARRGEGEDQGTMEKQMGQNPEALDLGGWFFEEERLAYQKMVRSITNGKIVEVGVWKGLSLSSILDICRENNNELYAVDSWMPIEHDGDYRESLTSDIFGIFTTNLRLLGHTDTVRVIRKPSLLAAEDFEDHSLDMVFIDADHSFEAVLADIRKWWSRLRTGGILAGHDFTFKEGVCRAVTLLFHDQVELAGGSVWKVVKKEEDLVIPANTKAQKGRGCIFIPTFRDTHLLEENYSGRPEIPAAIDVVVVDDNHEHEESERVKALCLKNGWTYMHFQREKHGGWREHYKDISGYNRFIWSSFTALGQKYDYVIKMDTDAYIVEPDFFLEMDGLLYKKCAGAGTYEYRHRNDVKSFWTLEGVKNYSFRPGEYVPHLQGGIYGLSKKALEEISAMGFLEGIHEGFAEDGYMSYSCLLLEIPLLPVQTSGSWYRPYRPDIKSLAGMKAVHPMTKKEWKSAFFTMPV